MTRTRTFQSANGLTTRLGVKKADDTALTVTTKKN